MAEDDYNFDEFLDDDKQQSGNINEKRTKDNRGGKREAFKIDSSTNKDKSKSIIHREGVENKSCAFFMNPNDAELIRAVAEIQGKPQGEFLSFLVDRFIRGKEKRVEKVLEEYRRRKNSEAEDLF